jgi:hypothetical protein
MKFLEDQTVMEEEDEGHPVNFILLDEDFMFQKNMDYHKDIYDIDWYMLMPNRNHHQIHRW